MENVKRLSEIDAKPVLRNRTWFNDLDYIYGTSKIPVDHEFASNNIGMPKGKISLWAGQSGVGKSRLCIEVAKKFSTNYIDGIVLYFLTESDMSDFASWAKNTTQYDKIYCSGENHIDKMIEIIYQIKPKLIFIDSVNEVDEFENGNKQEARRLINGLDDRSGLKQATHDVGAHLILLGQLNQDGKTIKGGTSLPHLVDIALNIVKTDEIGVFKVEVGSKHRYGSTENVALFRHTDDGVIEYVAYVAPVVQVPVQQVDPKSLPSQWVGEQRVYEPFYAGGKLWDVRQQEHYLKTKAEMVASGKIKLDSNGNIIPNKKGLLTRLNRGVADMFGLK